MYEDLFVLNNGDTLPLDRARKIMERLSGLREANYSAFLALVFGSQHGEGIPSEHWSILYEHRFIDSWGNILDPVKSVAIFGVEYSHETKAYVLRDLDEQKD